MLAEFSIEGGGVEGAAGPTKAVFALVGAEAVFCASAWVRLLATPSGRLSPSM
jgi:hypothetical protein